MEALDRCDAVVAILDGSDSDSGTCIEIGYARAKGKPVIGVRTDFRDGEVHGLNIMTAGICSAIVKLPSTCGTISGVAEKVVEPGHVCEVVSVAAGTKCGCGRRAPSGHHAKCGRRWSANTHRETPEIGGSSLNSTTPVSFPSFPDSL